MARILGLAFLATPPPSPSPTPCFSQPWPQFSTQGRGSRAGHQPSNRDEDVEDSQHAGPLVPHEEVAQHSGRDGGVAGRAGTHSPPGQEEEPGVLSERAQDHGECRNRPWDRGARGFVRMGPRSSGDTGVQGVGRVSATSTWCPPSAHPRLPTSHKRPLLVPSATACMAGEQRGAPSGPGLC